MRISQVENMEVILMNNKELDGIELFKARADEYSKLNFEAYNKLISGEITKEELEELLISNYMLLGIFKNIVKDVRD